MVMRTWVQILQMKVSISVGNNNYTNMSLLLELNIYPPTPVKIPTPSMVTPSLTYFLVQVSHHQGNGQIGPQRH